MYAIFSLVKFSLVGLKQTLENSRIVKNDECANVIPVNVSVVISEVFVFKAAELEYSVVASYAAGDSRFNKVERYMGFHENFPCRSKIFTWILIWDYKKEKYLKLSEEIKFKN